MKLSFKQGRILDGGHEVGSYLHDQGWLVAALGEHATLVVNVSVHSAAGYLGEFTADLGIAGRFPEAVRLSHIRYNA